MKLFGSSKPDLDVQLSEYNELLKQATPDLEADSLERSQEVAKLANERLQLDPATTVIALVGATGSGKSSLFNAIIGADIVTTGVRRPTTIHPTAAITSGPAVNELMDWLGIHQRVQIPTDGNLPENVALIDLPDIDSIATAGREVVKFLSKRVDLLIWVADPQKYADNLLHSEFIRPLANHAAMTLGVLTHADTLQGTDAVHVLEDFKRILEADNVPNPLVIASSAKTGQGIDTLRMRIADAAKLQLKATQKLVHNLESQKQLIGAEIFGDIPVAGFELPELPERKFKPQVMNAIHQVAGVETVEKTVRDGYRHRAGKAAGFWPLRRLRMLRPDPVKRLHLGAETGITSYQPLEMTLRNLELVLRETVAEMAQGRPLKWQQAFREQAHQANEFLPLQLNHAVSRTDAPLPAGKAKWWRVANLLQMFGWLTALGGLTWLVALHVAKSFLLIEVPSFNYYNVPVPVWLMAFGGAWALLVSLITGGLIRWRAHAAGRKASAKLREKLDQVVEEYWWNPLKLEDTRQRRILQLLQK